ncbi:MAG: trigger factor, partial [Solirubrobacteraceae bacterium]
MEITKNQIDQLNLEIKVKKAKKDYQGNVEQLLKNHKKKANIKGFRPGLAPMSLIKKQYQEPIRIEEINKLLSESLDKYIKTESLNILGYPIPKQKETIDWDAEELIFEYELGLSPEVRVELELVKATYYKIIASNEQLDKYIENFKLNFGEQIVLENVEEDTNLSVKIKTINNDLLDKVIYFNLKEVNKELFLGKNKNEEFTTKPSDLFTSMDSFIEITQMQKEELEGIFNNDL